jgi:hypothetical protein
MYLPLKRTSIPRDFVMEHELISIFIEFNDRIAPTPAGVDMRQWFGDSGTLQASTVIS